MSVERASKRVLKMVHNIYAILPMEWTWCCASSIPSFASKEYLQTRCHLYGFNNYQGSSRQCRSAEKKGLQSFWRSRWGLGTKIHIIISRAHWSLGFFLSPWHKSDMSIAQEVIEHYLPDGDYAFVADKWYDSDKIRIALKDKWMEAVIPGKRNRKNPIIYNTMLYRWRQEVERHMRFMKQARRIATRYDKLDIMFSGFIALMSLLLWFRVM